MQQAASAWDNRAVRVWGPRSLLELPKSAPLAAARVVCDRPSGALRPISRAFQGGDGGGVLGMVDGGRTQGWQFRLAAANPSGNGTIETGKSFISRHIRHRRDEMTGSKRLPKSKPRQRPASQGSLRRRMSEVISLRERVAQAELHLPAESQLGRGALDSVIREAKFSKVEPVPRRLELFQFRLKRNGALDS
jgi:hypothetical protein